MCAIDPLRRDPEHGFTVSGWLRHGIGLGMFSRYGIGETSKEGMGGYVEAVGYLMERVSKTSLKVVVRNTRPPKSSAEEEEFLGTNRKF